MNQVVAGLSYKNAKYSPILDIMQTSQAHLIRALRNSSLLFAINATLLTLIPFSLVCGLGEISYFRRPDLVYLLWAFLFTYPCMMVLPIIRTIRLWLRLGNMKRDELNDTGLIIASTQLTHVRYWGRLLMLANLLYFPFLLLGIYK